MMKLRLLPITIAVMALLFSAKVATFAKDATTAMGVGSGMVSSLTRGGARDCGTNADVKSSSTEAQVAQSDSERALLEDLKRRQGDLDRREQALDERRLVLDALEARLQDKMIQLTGLRDRIEQLDALRRQREDANWTGLVKTYQSMRAQDAATIFDALDMHVVLEVLDRMSERKAAAVLAAMLPERARQATQMLAEARLRRETVPPPTTAKPLN